jgi:aspartyl-tRNA synthetase
MSAPEAPLLPPAAAAAAAISKKQRNKDARKAAKAEKVAQRQQPTGRPRPRRPTPSRRTTATSPTRRSRPRPYRAARGPTSAPSAPPPSAAPCCSAGPLGRSPQAGLPRAAPGHGVVHAGGDGPGVSPGMVCFAAALGAESVVEVEGVVAAPRDPVLRATARHVEVRFRRIHCVARASRSLPFSLDDAEAEAELEGPGTGRARVGQDTRFNQRALDLRTPANQAIFRIQFQVENVSNEL